jgi:hypothetical protein
MVTSNKSFEYKILGINAKLHSFKRKSNLINFSHCPNFLSGSKKKRKPKFFVRLDTLVATVQKPFASACTFRNTTSSLKNQAVWHRKGYGC